MNTETICKNCANRTDCWIRDVIEFRRPLPATGSEKDVCIGASRGECPVFEEAD